MSSTHMYQGMNTDNKPSSRVLRPPGGGHSDIFGVGPPAAAPSPARTRPGASSNIFGASESTATPNSKDRPSYHASNSTVFGGDPEPVQRNPYKPVASNPIYGNQAEEEGAYKKKTVETDPITGETKSYAIGGTGEAVNRPSTRVKQPPGGGCSGPLW